MTAISIFLNYTVGGIRSFVVRELPDMAAFPDANFLQVLNPLKALQRLAERHRESFDIPVVGVTGSNGKTVVKEWLYQLMSSDKIVARSPRSYNSQIGVPLSVWTLSESTELGIFEAGISLARRGGCLAVRYSAYNRCVYRIG